MIKFFQKFRTPLLLCSLLCFCFLLAEPTFAAESSTPGSLLSTVVTGFFAGILIIIAVLSIVFATLLGDMMSSFYVFGDGMGETLQLVWEVMRNLVNIGFIVIFLILAATVVLGLGQDGGTGRLKAVLPKLILALVAVNLTFFAARFILTTSDVLSTAVFTLPRIVSPDKQIRSLPCEESYEPVDSAQGFQWEVCKEQIWGSVDGLMSSDVAKEKIAAVAEQMGSKTSDTTIKSFVGRETAPLALLMNILDLKKMLWIKSSIGGVGDFIVSILGSIVTAGAVAIVYLMLFVAFVIRLVVLWIYIVLMPVGVFAFVLKEVVPGIEFGGDGAKDFINAALMPVYAAVPLSIGMIMIFANNSVAIQGDNVTSLSGMAGNLNSILWWAASIVIIWYGTQKAIEMGNEQAAKATGAIQSAVNGAVGATAGTLKYVPFLPGGSAGAQSLAGIASQPFYLQDKYKDISRGQAIKLGRELGTVNENSATNDSITSASSYRGKTKFESEILANQEALKRILEEETANEERAASAKNIFSDKFVKANQAAFSDGKITTGEYKALLKKASSKADLSDGMKASYSSGDEILADMQKALEAHEEGTYKSPEAPTETPAAAPTATQKVKVEVKDGKTGTKVESKADNVYVVEQDGEKTYFESTDGGKTGEKLATEKELVAKAKKISSLKEIEKKTEEKSNFKSLYGEEAWKNAWKTSQKDKS